MTVEKRTTIHVRCYAGHRGEERPEAFNLAGQELEVTDVIQQWVTPDHRCFKVKGDDGHTYVLRQEIASGQWELEWALRGTTFQ